MPNVPEVYFTCFARTTRLESCVTPISRFLPGYLPLSKVHLMHSLTATFSATLPW